MNFSNFAQEKCISTTKKQNSILNPDAKNDVLCFLPQQKLWLAFNKGEDVARQHTFDQAKKGVIFIKCRIFKKEKENLYDLILWLDQKKNKTLYIQTDTTTFINTDAQTHTHTGRKWKHIQSPTVGPFKAQNLSIKLFVGVYIQKKPGTLQKEKKNLTSNPVTLKWSSSCFCEDFQFWKTKHCSVQYLQWHHVTKATGESRDWMTMW